MATRSLLLGSMGLGLVGVAVGCSAAAGTTDGEINTSKPHLLALSSYQASLGTPIDAFMANPPDATAKKIELVFDGTFRRASGAEEKVSLAQPTTRLEAGAVRWTSFGPFANPFTPNNPDIGVFTGKVGVRVTLANGTTVTDEAPLPIRFEVKPSIIVTELQPTTAACDKPALRLIGMMKYKMRASTLGFKATSFEYAIKTPRMTLDNGGLPVMDKTADGSPKYTTTLVNHAVGDTSTKGNTTTDKVDDGEAITIPPVPSDRPSYGVVFVVTARDDAGHQVKSTFGMTVHNPLEVFHDGDFTLAQIYPAQPVSACMPGGQQGREVDYVEANKESRQRELTVTLSRDWLRSDQNTWSTSDGRTVTTSKTVTDGYSRTHGTENTFSFTKSRSDTTGLSFNWSDSTNVHGEAKVSFKPEAAGMSFGGVEAGGGGGKTWTNGGSRSSSTTNGTSETTSNSVRDEETRSHSTATTDETSINRTDTKGGGSTVAEGGANDTARGWKVTSEDTIQKGFGGQVIANTYGVFYRQMARYTQRAFVLEHNKCGESEIVGDVTLQDYIWAPDLALSNACPPLPNSNFPKAQCFLPPCDP